MSSGATGISTRSSSPRRTGAHQRHRFQQLVARQRQQPALGHFAQRVSGAAHPLQERADRAGRADLANQVDVADVDAHLERGGGHDRAQFALFEPLFGRQANFAREAAVMAATRFFAQQLAQVMGHALGQAARVDEHQRAAMLSDQLGEPSVDFGPLFVGADGREFAGRNFHAQVELARVAAVDDRAVGRVVGADLLAAHQEAGDLVDGTLRGRQSDAHDAPLVEPLQPLERQRQVRAALVAHHGVDFVDDHGLDRVQQRAALGRGEQQVQRLGRGHQNMRRAAQHGLPLAGRRVAGCAPARGCGRVP